MKTQPIRPAEVQRIGRYASELIVAGVAVISLGGILFWMALHKASDAQVNIETAFCCFLLAFIGIRCGQILRWLNERKQKNETSQS